MHKKAKFFQQNLVILTIYSNFLPKNSPFFLHRRGLALSKSSQ